MDERDALLIGGEWAQPAEPGSLPVISPITEEPFASVPLATAADVDAAVAAGHEAFESGPWARMGLDERAECLEELMGLLHPHTEEATRLQVDEMGAPYTYLLPLTQWILGNVSAEKATVESISSREIRHGRGGDIIVTRDPVGVSGAIIPWNAPFAHALHKAVAPLLAGNSVVVKPSPESPISAYLIAEAVVHSNLPKGVLSIVAGGREVGERLVTHPLTRHISFTGSTATGRRVGALGGECLTPCNLELGGKSAAIVLADADPETLIGHLIESAVPNTGQVCYATTRVLLPRARFEEVVGRLADRLGSMTVGDPHKEDTDFGPLVSQRQRERVEEYVASGREEGARVILGGGRPAELSRGWYVEPTIFVDVTNDMRIAREEIFGPVIAVLQYDSEEEAIAMANDSDYGLGGAVYTTDIAHGVNVAERIVTGSCRINGAPGGGGGGPFSGVKNSGMGRKHGPEGYENLFTIKSITVPVGA